MNYDWPMKFIITVFTNVCLLNTEMLECFIVLSMASNCMFGYISSCQRLQIGSG